jgi:SAM-dependent methyltransferase
LHAAAGPDPHVLDLGAGQGAATIPFLELGASVTAVDDSEEQLDRLRARCRPFGPRLTIVRADAAEFVWQGGRRYDSAVLSSFLHHVPDYAAFLGAVADERLEPRSHVLTFQDPLLYRSLGRPTRAFGALAYASWRLRRGDVVGGLRRRARRSRGVWRDDCPQDVVEYHATRGGVDQDAVVEALVSRGYRCRMERYFSTQSGAFQAVGDALGLLNTFAVVAHRPGGS